MDYIACFLDHVTILLTYANCENCSK